jgi:hypothetical protein
VPGSSRVLNLRAADPDPAAPPWVLRLARSRTGLECGTVGQLHDGTLGLVGLDRRFRALPEANADACGQAGGKEPALLGTRVFDAPRYGDVRTIVNGVAGEDLARVTVAAAGKPPRVVGHSPEGGFLVAIRGYPEDVAPVVTLRWRDGRTRRYAFAASQFVVPDPLGGRAWKVSGGFGASEVRTIGHRNGRPIRASVYDCVAFGAARYFEGAPRSPSLCGRNRMALKGPDRTLFFGTRRLRGDRDIDVHGIALGDWNGRPPRTAVWGKANPDLVRALIVTAPGVRREFKPPPGGSFLVVLDPKVDPAAIRVEIRFRDGHSERGAGNRGLVRRPG